VLILDSYLLDTNRCAKRLMFPSENFVSLAQAGLAQRLK